MSVPDRRVEGMHGLLMALGHGLTRRVESATKTRNLWDRLIGPVLAAKLDEWDVPKEQVDPVEFATRIGLLGRKKRKRIGR